MKLIFERLFADGGQPAAFRRLCVETGTEFRRFGGGNGRLQAAVC